MTAFHPIPDVRTGPAEGAILTGFDVWYLTKTQMRVGARLP